MSFLDIRTVMFSQLVTDAVCTAVLILLWLQNRKRYAGTFFWAVDFIFQTTAFLLIILRGSIPDWMSMGVSNTLVIAGALVGYWGLERFVGRKSSQIHNLILLGIFILVHFYFIYAHPDLQARNLNVSLGLLLVCSQCALLMLRRAGRTLIRITQGVGWVFALFCLVSLVRIFIILAIPQPSNDFFKSGFYDALMLMSYQVLLILLAFGLALMVNQRLLGEARTQEEKFTRAFHSSPYAILITRLADGLILDVNRGFEAIVGYPSSEAVGKTTLDLHLWGKETDRQEVVAELSARGEVQGRELQFRAKSGRELTGLFYAELFTIEEERFILSSINDITERKQADQTIRSLARFPSENPNPVLRIAAGGNLLYANEATFVLMADWKLEVGKPVPEALEGLTRKVFEKHTMKAVEIPCGERIFSIVIAPTAEDEYVNLYGSDITERKRVEEALRESEDKFKYVFDYSVVGKSITLPAGGIHVNKAFCEMLGYSSEELQNTNWRDISHPDDNAMTQRELDFLLSGEKDAVRFTKRYIHKNGSIMWANVSTSLRRDQEGKPLYFMTSVIDITEGKRVEGVLQESEEKYRLIAENADDWIYWLEPDRKLRYISPSCERVTGYTPAEFADDPNLFFEIAHPEDKGIMEDHFAKIRDETGPDSLEYRIVTKTGEVRWIDHSCRPVYNQESHYAGRRGTNRNITGRKQAEEALRQSENTVRAWLNAIQESAFLMDREGIILAANATMAQRLGRSVEELVGACTYDFIPPQTAHARRLHVAQVIESGQPVRFEDGRSGRVFDNLIYPVFDQSGQVKRMAILGTDVTERKQAEEEIHKLNAELEQRVAERTAQLQTANKQLESELAERKRAEESLRETEERFRRLSEATFEAIVIHEGGILLSANNQYCEMFGCEPEELLGKQVMPLTVAPEALEAMRKEIATGGVGPYESTGLRKDGTRFPMEIRVREMEYNRRKVRVAAIMDITERKRAEEALQQRTAQLEAANKELEAFSYSVSHDLCSPLRAMSGFSRILLEEYTAQLPAEAQRYLGLVRDNAQQMGRLIEDLLAFSRLSRQPLNKQTVTPAEIVQKALAELGAERGGRNVEITIGDLPACEADPVLLKQVWVNLLSNALKFTRKQEDTHIEIGYLPHPSLPSPAGRGEGGEGGAYFVRDNGVGFDMQYVHKLFGVFQRLHRAEEYEGTGVGLAIVQRIILRHGGGIWTEAEVDKGATFYFTLGGGSQ